MWIQVRTIDGAQTQTIDDLSRLTKIESLREKIQESFRVSPDRQRLFYRGKQLEDGHTLFDYNVGLNDIVQLLIRSESDAPTTPLTNKDGKPSPSTVANCKNKVKQGANSGSSNLPSTSARSFLIDPGIGQYKINELVDARDVTIGSWFEAHIENVTRATKGHKNGKAQGKSGSNYKRTNGNISQDHSRENTNNLDNAPSTSYSDYMDTDEDIIYHIKYDEYPESGIVEMTVRNLRPRARTILKWNELRVGDVVMVNYNVESPEERGFWFDAEITNLREISRTNKEVYVKIMLGRLQNLFFPFLNSLDFWHYNINFKNQIASVKFRAKIETVRQGLLQIPEVPCNSEQVGNCIYCSSFSLSSKFGPKREVDKQVTMVKRSNSKEECKNRASEHQDREEDL
ncbi:E3 ubiquitin-protein ligase UHRF2 [Varanus komodoensis]|nr:E3 ubiquitin-protein ligase UHRF2 [Varanus komodoensis]